MKIIVTPEEMRSNATSLRSEKANFEQCISSMRTIVNSMSGVFEGEAAAATYGLARIVREPGP